MKIERSIRPEHMDHATAMYVEAFQRKFVFLLGQRTSIIRIIRSGFNANRAITAVSSDGQLIGLAGYHWDKHALVDVTLASLRKEFGWWKGLYKALLMGIFFTRTPQKKELLMDGIVVDPQFRGMGAGKLLFSELEQLAKESRLQYIRLDVIEENPKAKALYQSLDFVVLGYKKLSPWVTKVVGTAGVYSMRKAIVYR